MLKAIALIAGYSVSNIVNGRHVIPTQQIYKIANNALIIQQSHKDHGEFVCLSAVKKAVVNKNMKLWVIAMKRIKILPTILKGLIFRGVIELIIIIFAVSKLDI